MHDPDFTHHDPLDDIDELLAIRAHSPRFWDADAAEQVHTDPYDHPSWDVHDALTDGWDDPAEACAVLDQTVITDHRLLPLADTPTERPWVHHVDQCLAAHDSDPDEGLLLLTLELALAEEVRAA